MIVSNRPIDSIRPYERNPRHNDPGVDAVAQSLKQYGWRQPIVVDEAGVIVVGHTRYKAALKLGMSIRTAYRRLEEAEFRLRLQNYRAEMVYRATGMLTAGSMEAVKTLLSLMGAGNAAAARLGAARAVLDMGLRLREASELEERMSKIEERLQ